MAKLTQKYDEQLGNKAAIGVIAGAPKLNTGANGANGVIAGAPKLPTGAAGVLAGATAATAAAAKNGNTNNKGNGGGTGVGTGTAVVSPSVQAAASGESSQTGTPAAAQTENLYPVRPANEEYSASQAVQNALANLNAINAQQPGAYNPSQSVMDAQAAMLNAQAGKPGAYTPSAEVLAAQQALQALQTTKPQAYSSKYQPQLDALLEQIQNPGQFKYEFNGDNLFKMYADEYTQRAKQAAQNVMGQAAALTGGYGNSYAQQVANQAYDQNLTELYDRGLELRDRAYEAWLNEQQDKYNQYGLLNDAENRAYNRYRDTVGDWENERGYLTDMYNNERNFDYNKYQDLMQDYYNNLNYYTGRYDTERNTDYGMYGDAYDRWANDRSYAANRYDTERNMDYGMYGDRVNRAEEQYQYDTNMNENIRQFNATMDYNKMSDQQKYAADYSLAILANGQMPSLELLQAAGLNATDAAKLMAKIAPTVTVTGGGSGKDSENAPKTYLTDLAGNYYTTNDKGGYTKVDSSTVKPTDYVDTSKQYGISLTGLGGATMEEIAKWIGKNSVKK